jgi:hypothetical protein
MRCAQGGMGDCLTAAARPAPRPITEREQSCLIAGYRIRAERRLGMPIEEIDICEPGARNIRSGWLRLAGSKRWRADSAWRCGFAWA